MIATGTRAQISPRILFDRLNPSLEKRGKGDLWTQWRGNYGSELLGKNDVASYVGDQFIEFSCLAV